MLPANSQPNDNRSATGAEACSPDRHVHGPACARQRTFELARAIEALQPALAIVELIDDAEAEFALVDEAIRRLDRRLDMTLRARLGLAAADDVAA